MLQESLRNMLPHNPTHSTHQDKSLIPVLSLIPELHVEWVSRTDPCLFAGHCSSAYRSVVPPWLSVSAQETGEARHTSWLRQIEPPTSSLAMQQQPSREFLFFCSLSEKTEEACSRCSRSARQHKGVVRPTEGTRGCEDQAGRRVRDPFRSTKRGRPVSWANGAGALPSRDAPVQFPANGNEHGGVCFFTTPVVISLLR